MSNFLRVGTVETINDINDQFKVYFDGNTDTTNFSISKEKADEMIKIVKSEYNDYYRQYLDDYKNIEKDDFIWDDDDNSWYINGVFIIPKFVDKPTKNQIICSMFYSDIWESLVSI